MQISNLDKEFMNKLLNFLKSSNDLREIPVASLIISNRNDAHEIYRNMKESLTDPTGHAEIIAIRTVAKKNNICNLEGFTLYTTLEPCLMCTGAIIEARISRVVYGAFSTDSSNLTITEVIRSKNRKVEVIGGVMEKEFSQIISRWFSVNRETRI